jgi:inorganic triphosphatase YgiF
MLEIELKFQVPAAERAAVRRAVSTATARTTHLQARYFDTPDRRLAAAGLALRLRKEGRRWVQTLKGRGDGLMQRLEHEVVLSAPKAGPAPAAGATPVLDVALHAGTPAGAALMRALGDATTLTERYATDIRRTHRVVRLPGNNVVELAFDEGEIRAGEARLAVCELEFELQHGAADALPRLAQRWVERHGLWLDVRSKAERGERLALGLTQVPASKSSTPALRASMRGDEALRTLLASALEQVLRNACELAGGGASADALHQCRVGLRRLRSLLRDFGGLDPADTAQAAFTTWQAALADLFRRLGSARDRDALRETLLPALAAAGAPALDLPPAHDHEAPDAVLREAACNALWLQVIAYLHAAAAPTEVTDASDATNATAASPDLRRSVGAELRRLHRQVVEGAATFATLEEAGQHRVRKRLKRLRYGAEAVAALYPAKAVSRYLAALRPAQDALGAYNDLLVARALFEAMAHVDPHAWFALGWLAARKPSALAQCTEALARIEKAPKFWRR